MQVNVLSLELVSPTLPEGKVIKLDLTSQASIEEAKKNPITIKEGVEYKYGSHLELRPRLTEGYCSVLIRFKVNHSIIS